MTEIPMAQNDFATGPLITSEEKTSELGKDDTLFSFFMNLFCLAWPNSISFIMWPLHNMIGIYFVGQLNKVEYLDAVTLGSCWIGLTVYSIQIGMASALSTLISQSYGKKEYAMCGIFLNRAFIIINLVTIPCVFLLCLSGQIFRLCGIQSEVAYHSHIFCIYMIPVVFFNIPWILLENFLNLQKIVQPQMYIQIINTCLYPLFCYVFINLLNLNYLGAVAAKITSIIFYVGVLSLYIWKSKCCELTFVKFGAEAWKGWKEFFDIAIPAAIMCCLEWWVWEIMNLFSGMLGKSELAASSIILNLGGVTVFTSAGFGVSTGTLVGISLGESNRVKAKIYATLGIICTFTGNFITNLVIIVFRKEIAKLFIKDKEVSDIMEILLLLFTANQAFDNTNVTLSKLMVTIGKQKYASYVNLFSYWGIMLPSSIILGFVLKFGVYGMWVSFIFGSVTAFTCFCIIIYRQDFAQLIKESHERIEIGKLAD